jgi:hypothetical protein
LYRKKEKVELGGKTRKSMEKKKKNEKKKKMKKYDIYNEIKTS